MPRDAFPLVVALALLQPGFCPGARGDDPPSKTGGFATLADLDAAYDRQVLEIDRRKIADLDRLAAKAGGAEAEGADRRLFRLAIARDLYRDAQPAAERRLKGDARGEPADLRALATFVRVIGREDRGEFDRSLDDLLALFKDESRRGADGDDLALAVGEAYLRRLIRAGRFDVARKLCEAAGKGVDVPKAIRDHFGRRLGRLDLLGKPAPAIEAADVDGRAFSLAGQKGKVVLVEFWATWCPPCVEEVPRLVRLSARSEGRPFAIVGINVDAIHEDVKDVKAALPVVRKFLVGHGVLWTNILDGGAKGGIADAFGVEEIPANVLIGRDGTVLAVDVVGEDLDRAIQGALGPSSLP